MSIPIRKSLQIKNPKDINRNLQLCVGDITDLNEEIDFIIISAFSNNYSKTSGSIIESLYKKGIDVENLSQNRELNFNQHDKSCWISKPFKLNNRNIRLLCIEINNIEDAQSHIDNIFLALRFFYRNKSLNNLEVAIPMIFTGSGHTNINNIFYSLFYESVHLMSLNDFNFNSINLICFNESQYECIIKDFNDYCQKYNDYNRRAESSDEIQNLKLRNPFLTSSQIYGIRDYTGYRYIEINYIMRTYDINCVYYKDIINEIVAIKAGLENLPLAPKTTYRGEVNTQYEESKVFLKAFTSSTRNPDRIFEGNKIIIKGQYGKDIQILSKYEKEEEHLYSPMFVNIKKRNPIGYIFTELTH